MAIVTFPPGAPGFNRSIGGASFSQNHNGPQIKSRRKGITFRSPKVTQNRTNFTHLVQAWKDIIQPRKDGWIFEAAIQPRINSLGQTYYLSGYQLFVSFNQVRLNQGRSIQESATGSIVFPALSLSPVIIDIDPIDIEISWVPNYITTFYEFRIWASNIISDGFVPSFPQDYKLIHTLYSGEVGPQVIWPYWKSVYGPGPTNVVGVKYNWAIYIALQQYNWVYNQANTPAINHGSIIQ